MVSRVFVLLPQILLGDSRRTPMTMNCRSFGIEAMHEVKMIGRLECLLLANHDKLMLVNGLLDLLEVFFADVVQIDTLDFGSELCLSVRVTHEWH